MVSDARWAQSREVGKQGEESFVLACEALGYRCRKSSRQEDIELHIDYWVTRPQGETSVDVKGQKQNEQVWVNKCSCIWPLVQHLVKDLQQLEC